MNNDGVIKTAIGGLVSIKVIETGMKLITNSKKKINKNGIFDSKKKNKFL